MSSDRSPGDYYLFDTRTRKADYFAAVRDWINPEEMSERRPIQLKARDGTQLWGYLTLPKGRDPRKLPLVVNPHGGPFYIRDRWGFDSDAQLLANRGYAVLQVNFRGSGGYGSDFVTAGKKAWATTMIADITDATRWTIAQGYADPSRVCIYGASYGGYAALMSAIVEPDLYRCVIGYAGVYDLQLLKKDSDLASTNSGKKFFAEAIAGTDQEMIGQSPINYLDQLRAPVLIVHGKDDARAPFSQAKALRSALESRKHRYQWLVRGDEGHGFWQVENIEAFYSTLIGFIDQNIGPASLPPAPAPVTAQTGAASPEH